MYLVVDLVLHGMTKVVISLNTSAYVHLYVRTHHAITSIHLSLCCKSCNNHIFFLKGKKTKTKVMKQCIATETLNTDISSWSLTPKNICSQNWCGDHPQNYRVYNHLRFRSKTTIYKWYSVYFLHKAIAEKKHLRPPGFLSIISQPWPSL